MTRIKRVNRRFRILNRSYWFMIVVLLLSLVITIASADVSPTPYWVNFWGQNTLVNGEPIAVGTTIDAYDPQGTHCGTFTVHTEGSWGYMPVYGDDGLSAEDEGASPGDTITFKIGAVSGGSATWPGAPSLPIEIDLAFTGFSLATGEGEITDKGGNEYELSSSYFTERVDANLSDSPNATLYKWNEECYLNISYPSLALTPAKSVENNKVVWRDGDIEIRQYFLDGHFEFEVILHSKPASNQIVLDIDTRGLVFYYQDELTPEEIADGAERPENVVGSYAVYHKSKKDHIIGQANYGPGKAFHIYRPQPVDSEGRTVWADLLIENGKMTVTIPQKFLDEAVYPIYHATGATFGDTSTGASNINIENIIRARVATGAAGTATKMFAYLNITPVNKLAKTAIYADSDNAIIPNGDVIEETVTTGVTPLWWDWVFAVNPTVSVQTYFLAVWMETAGGAGHIRYDNGAASSGNDHGGQAYNGWPATYNDSFNAREYSIYVEYTPAAPPSAVGEISRGYILD